MVRAESFGAAYEKGILVKQAGCEGYCSTSFCQGSCPTLQMSNAKGHDRAAASSSSSVRPECCGFGQFHCSPPKVVRSFKRKCSKEYPWVRSRRVERRVFLLLAGSHQVFWERGVCLSARLDATPCPGVGRWEVEGCGCGCGCVVSDAD